jgi:hypothetical protein
VQISAVDKRIAVYLPHGTTVIVITIIVKRATIAASNWAAKHKAQSSRVKDRVDESNEVTVCTREGRKHTKPKGSTRERGVGGAQPTSRPWPPCGGRDGGFSSGRASLRYAAPDQEPRSPS